jgi:hypothetical protein
MEKERGAARQGKEEENGYDATEGFHHWFLWQEQFLYPDYQVSLSRNVSVGDVHPRKLVCELLKLPAASCRESSILKVELFILIAR